MNIFNALKGLLRILWTGADGLRKVLHLLLLLFLFAIIGGVLTPAPTPLPASAALVISPAGALVEELEGDPFERAVAEILEDAPPQTLVRDVVDALAYAKDDDRIKVVLLELDGVGGGGLAKLQRIGEAIDEFRESGKSVIATANFYSQPAYYLAARADEIYMHPQGMFMPQGFAFFTNFFSDALENLKVDWNVFRVGTHKSAVEPFTRMDMSAEERESRSRLLADLWQIYQRDVVSARGLEAGAVDAFASNLLANQETYDGDIARAAADLGFVDGLITRHELQAMLAELAGEDRDSNRGYSATGLSEYLRQMRLLDGPTSADENVAIIVASGEVLNGDQAPGLIGGESTSALLARARLDESVKAVVLRIDSPGGSSFAAQQIRAEVEALRAAGKPVVASMSSVAASAGYAIAMAADEIVARESTITGSIGVFLMFPTFQRSLGELGVATDGVGTTPWSGQFRLDRELSADARTFLQNFVNEDYDEFISMVAVYREMDKSRVDEVAQGQVWTGSEAIDFGLVDTLGDLDEAIARAADLAELDDSDYGRKWIERRLSPTEQMIVELLGSAARNGFDIRPFRPAPSAAAQRLLRLVDDSMGILLRFNDPRGSYSYCFCAVH